MGKVSLPGRNKEPARSFLNAALDTESNPIRKAALTDQGTAEEQILATLQEDLTISAATQQVGGRVLHPLLPRRACNQLPAIFLLPLLHNTQANLCPGEELDTILTPGIKRDVLKTNSERSGPS